MSKEIPVFLVLGFLESGKTTFIKDTLLDEYFADGSKTLIVECEEGEEEFSRAWLTNAKASLVTFDNQTDFTPEALHKAEEEHKPDRIFIEYNGMWPLNILSDTLEKANWPLAQVLMIAKGEGFDLYLNNMRSLIVEELRVSDVAIFNRCVPETPRAALRRLAKAANPRIQIAFEAADGVSLSDADALPYDLNAAEIVIEDTDYAVFHMDAMENTERYEGKKIRFKGQYCKPRFGAGKGTFIAGRFAMVCCANDVQFIGYLAAADPYKLKGLKEREWLEVVATVKYEKRSEYQGVGPVLYAESVEPCEAPKEDVVYF